MKSLLDGCCVNGMRTGVANTKKAGGCKRRNACDTAIYTVYGTIQHIICYCTWKKPPLLETPRHGCRLVMHSFMMHPNEYTSTLHSTPQCVTTLHPLWLLNMPPQTPLCQQQHHCAVNNQQCQHSYTSPTCEGVPWSKRRGVSFDQFHTNLYACTQPAQQLSWQHACISYSAMVR